MKKNTINIIGFDSDKESVEKFRLEFEAKNHDICFLSSSDDDISEAISTLRAVLWLTPNTPQEVYDVAEVRMKRGKTTINFFVEPTALTPNQKEIVGRNSSVFAELSKDRIVPDICKLYSLGLDNVTELENMTEEAKLPISIETYEKVEDTGKPSVVVPQVALNQPSPIPAISQPQSIDKKTEKASSFNGDEQTYVPSENENDTQEATEGMTMTKGLLYMIGIFVLWLFFSGVSVARLMTTTVAAIYAINRIVKSVKKRNGSRSSSVNVAGWVFYILLIICGLLKLWISATMEGVLRGSVEDL